MKNTRFSVFVAALLCVVIALSSCTGSAVLPSDDELANDRTNEGAIVPVEDEGEGEGDENLPVIDTTTTPGKIAVWQKYLGYKAKTSDVAEKTVGKTFYIDKYVYESADTDYYGIVVRTYENEEELTNEEDLGKIKITEGFAIFNPYVKQDAIFSVQTYSFKADEYTGNPVEKVTRVSWSERSWGVFIIKYEAWDAVYEELPEGATQAPQILGYEIVKTTYDIFLCDGTEIAKGVESANITETSISGRYAIVYDGYAYLLDTQGRLINKVAKELAYSNPFLSEYDSDRFSQLGAYYVTEMGDGLGFFNEDGLLVSVLNVKDASRYDKAVVLPDSRILMQAFNGDYDNPVVKTAIFDPSTGKVGAVEFNYIIKDFVDETTDGMTVAEGFVFVEVCAIENGVAATENTYLVLKADLTVEATLPEIVMNQCGAIEFVDSDTFLIPASIGNDVYAYRVTDGNFYAFDFEVENFYDGMLLARDNDGKNNLVDMNGKIIVSDVNDAYSVQSSVVVRTYDEDGYVRYTVCYYDAENDTVKSRVIFSAGKYTSLNSYNTEMEQKLIVVDYTSYNSYYESNYKYREYYNVKGECVYSFSYTSRYNSRYVYVGSSSTTTYEVNFSYPHDAIVFKVTYEDGYSTTANDYIRYDIIK